nr:hypothetical protein [uncultured Campylobacter sp.]
MSSSLAVGASGRKWTLSGKGRVAFTWARRGAQVRYFLYGSQASANEFDRQGMLFGISRIVAAQKFVWALKRLGNGAVKI